MAEEKEIKQAKAAFTTLCKMLDAKQWNYDRDEAKLTISCGARGDDLPMDIRIMVDADRQLVSLYSILPFGIPEDKRTDLAIAVCKVNYDLVDGSFDYDYDRGAILFRLTSSFRESLVGQEMFEYMLFLSCGTIDRYNDRFLMLSKGMLGLDNFNTFED